MVEITRQCLNKASNVIGVNVFNSGDTLKAFERSLQTSVRRLSSRTLERVMQFYQSIKLDVSNFAVTHKWTWK